MGSTTAVDARPPVVDAGQPLIDAGSTIDAGPGVIALTMTATPDPVAVGSLVSYEIRVSNVGGMTLANVVLTEVAQNNAFVRGGTITGGGGCPGSCGPGDIITWPTATLAPGQTLTVSFMTDPTGTDGTVIRNTATVTSPGGTISQPLEVVVRSAAGLELRMAEDHDPAKPGDQIAYALTVGNPGTQVLPANAAGVLTATIPAGTTFVSASEGGTPSGSAVQWDIGGVNAGGSQHYTYTVEVGRTVGAGEVLLAQSQVLDGVNSLARATAATEVRAVPLTLTMIATPDPVAAAGALASYELRVSNLGSTTVQNVVLTEVPLNNAFVRPSTITGGGVCGGSCGPGYIITWPTATLAPGQTLTVSYMADASGPGGTLLHNAATVTFPGGTISKGLDVVVRSAAGLELRMEEDHDPAKPGDRIAYALTVGNAATQVLPPTATGVLTATIPAGTTFVSASTGGTPLGSTVQWNIGGVNAGGSQHYTYTVEVGNTVGTGTVLLAQSQVLSGENSLARATAATEVRAVPLALTMTATPDPVAATGALVSYELRVSNLGSTTVQNVVLTEVPLNNAFVRPATITGGGVCGGSCGPGLIITWPTASLAPGQTLTVAFMADASGPGGTLLHNAATVTFPGGTISKGLDVLVRSAAGLELRMEEDDDPAKPGDQIAYALTVGNPATQVLPPTATGVLTATIPAGTAFVSASAGGALSGSTVRWDIGGVEAGGSQRHAYTVALGGAVAAGTVVLAQSQVLAGENSLARATAATEVKTAVPLTLTMTATPDPAASGSLVSYDIRVANVSSTTVANVVLTEVPLNNAFVRPATITGGGVCGGSCGPGLIITWPTATLAPGQILTVSFMADVSGPSGTLLHNAATVTFPGGTLSNGLDVVLHQ